MKLILSLPPGLISTWVLLLSSTTQAHTWVEELGAIGNDGSFTGDPGYPRGYIDRSGQPDINTVYMLPPNGRPTGNAILPTDLMCRSNQLITSGQSSGFPALSVSPGDNIAIRYAENGHVTNPTLTPRGMGSGTVFIYGTTKAADTDTYLGVHRVWSADGTGGDGRGVLLATRYYDDGICHQVDAQQDGQIKISKDREAKMASEGLGNGKEILCQNDVQIPPSVTGSKYTLYWVWEWPQLQPTGAILVNESYTSCMDINLTPATSKSKPVKLAKDQNPNSAALAAQLGTAFLVNPTAAPVPHGGTPAALPSPAPTKPKASSAAPAPAISSAPTPIQKPSVNPNAGSMVTVTVTNSAARVTVTPPVKHVTVTMTNTPSATKSSAQSSQVPSANTPSTMKKPHDGVSPIPELISTSPGAKPVLPFVPAPESPVTKRWAPRGMLSRR